MERRTFLKLALLTTGSLFVDGGIGNRIHLIEKTKKEEITSELKTKVDEIAEYRSQWRLPRFPKELESEGLVAARELEETSAFKNSLPEFMQSYGQRIIQLLPLVFDKNASRLVHGEALNTSYNGYATFNSDTRVVSLSANTYKITPIDKNFLQIFFHEVAGHGSDPHGKKGLYPIDSLIRIMHGRWKILTQALNVEGEFLRHPSDLMLPGIQRNLGINIAKSFVADNKLTGQIEAGKDVLQEFITKKAREKGVSLEDFHFTRHVCAKLGKMSFDRVLDGTISLSGDLLQSYADTIENAFVEIYAEMVRYAVLLPNEIKNNSVIRDGVTEIFSAIQGKPVDLDTLREQVTPIPDNILSRFESECKLLQNQDEDNSVITPEQKDKINKEQKDLAQVSNSFDLFTQQATLPDSFSNLPKEQFDLLQQYANVATTIYKQYPEINGALTLWNLSFDPDLHAWETMDIASAANPSRIRNCLTNPNRELNNEGRTIIKKNIKILEKFIASSAFGTNNTN